MSFQGGMKRFFCFPFLLFAIAATASEPRSYATQRGADRFVAGGSALVSQDVPLAEDLYAAGGEVRFDRTLAGNARVAGGSVAFGRSARIEGNTSLAGGRVTMQGAIGALLIAFRTNLQTGA
jgi:hypothetical protein